MKSPSLFSLKNKVAVVTGALGLLGKQHCYALSEAGAKVIVCDLNENDCKDFAFSLEGENLGAGVDITSVESIKKLLANILDKFKRIDILVNNAAINDMFENPSAAAELSKFENYPLELWNKSLEVNITGTFLCSQIIGSQMALQKNGVIINIASTYGIVAPDQSIYKKEDGTQFFYKSPAYPATKGAVIALTKFLAAYWGKDGVRVNCLSPGGVENNQEEYFIKNYSANTPMGRMAAPTDYQGAIIFLASEASSYMTGANLIVDGGWTAW